MRHLLRYGRSLLPIILSGVLLFIIVRQTGVEAMVGRLRSLPVGSIIGAVIAFLVASAVGSWRYALVIKDLTERPPRIGQVLTINFLSLFLTYLVPIAALADVARVGGACRLLGLGPAASTRCVVHDRVLALAGLILSAVAVTPFLALVGADWQALSTSGFLAGGAMVAGTVVAVFTHPPSRTAPPFVAFLYRHTHLFQAHVASGWHLARQIFCAAVITGCVAAQVYVLALGLGIRLSPVAALAYTPLIALSQVIPFVYGGFGAREAAVVALLGSTWGSSDSALALGLMIGFTNMLASLPGIVAAGWFTYELSGGFKRRRQTTSPARLRR